MSKKKMELDFNEIRTVDLYPYEEVAKVMEAMKMAEKENDLDSLKWCARKVIWFFDMAETSTGCLSKEQQGSLFYSAYIGSDTPPASVAGIVE